MLCNRSSIQIYIVLTTNLAIADADGCWLKDEFNVTSGFKGCSGRLTCNEWGIVGKWVYVDGGEATCLPWSSWWSLSSLRHLISHMSLARTRNRGHSDARDENGTNEHRGFYFMCKDKESVLQPPCDEGQRAVAWFCRSLTSQTCWCAKRAAPFNATTQHSSSSSAVYKATDHWYHSCCANIRNACVSYYLFKQPLLFLALVIIQCLILLITVAVTVLCQSLSPISYRCGRCRCSHVWPCLTVEGHHSSWGRSQQARSVWGDADLLFLFILKLLQQLENWCGATPLS